MKRALLVFCAAAVALSGAVARAHMLDLTTARVALRDEHVSVTVETDVEALVEARARADATALAVASDADLAAWVDDTSRAVAQGAALHVDGAEVPLALRGFPTPAEVRAAAAERSSGSRAHPRMSELVYEERDALPNARGVTVQLPAALGRVLYTFVQPETKLATAGGAARFEVRGARPDTPVAPAPRTTTWAAGGAALLALLALGVALGPRSRPVRAEGT